MNDCNSNIFQLSEPDETICSVSSYQKGFSVLQIELLNPSDYLVFGTINFLSVLYFAGPFRWRGADFNYGSDEDQLQLQLSLGPNPYETDQELIDKAKLFVVKPIKEWLSDQHDIIKILAGGAKYIPYIYESKD